MTVRFFPLIFGVLGMAVLGFLWPAEIYGITSPPEVKEQLPVVLQADQLSYDAKSNGYHANGEVFLERGGWRLFSDHMSWYPDRDEATGEGHVRLLDAEENLLSAEGFEMNLKSGEGRLRKGKVFLKENNFHLMAEELRRLDEKNFSAQEASFTTCDGQNPAWRFQARDVKVTVDDYLRAKHLFFYLREIPVLYLPYLIYPVSDRKTGFLIPRYGYSEKRGAQIFQPFFWAISRNTDATFHLDYLSRLGLGKGVDYRYIARDDNKGEFSAYHVNGFDQGEDHLALSWKHDGFLPGRVRLAADVDYVDEKDYFEDFGQEAEDYNRETVQSVVFAQRHWEKLNLGAQLKYLKDLEKSSDDIVQRLPEIRLSLIRKRIGDTPFYYGFGTSYNHFWRREGTDGDRLLLRPFVAAAFKPANLLEVEAELGMTERLYWTSDKNTDRVLVDANVALSNRFSRIYPFDGVRIKKIRHTLQPEIRYSYLPHQDQDDLPQFDHLDDIEPRNVLSYSLINRLTARIEGSGKDMQYHEFLYLRLGQEFDIRESRRDREAGDDHLRPFSALRAEMILRPTAWSHLDLDATFDMNPEQECFETLRVGLGANDQRGNILGVGYSYLHGEYEYLYGNLATGILNPLFLSYSGRFDLSGGGSSLEHVMRAEWRFQCWSLFLTFRDRDDDREVLFSFSLRGLGNMFGS